MKKDMKNVVLSTRNPSKAHQIRAVFEGSPVSIFTLDDIGIEEEAVEDGLTLEENAEKKARFAHARTKPMGGKKMWAMADDTGIFIRALGGLPGVKSARWAGDTATTDEITQYTLDRLAGVTDRFATFETTVVVINPAGRKYVFTGVVEGRLLDVPRTKPQPKMPYSPLFIPNGSVKVWAEMGVEEENEISHRGIAFRLVRNFLENGTPSSRSTKY